MHMKSCIPLNDTDNQTKSTEHWAKHWTSEAEENETQSREELLDSWKVEKKKEKKEAEYASKYLL